MSEVKRHYIADESLGGIEREYVEVDWKADVGDYVVSNEQLEFIDRIYEVYHVSVGCILGKYSRGHASLSNYKTLSPTNIIRHNNVRYEMVDRRAEVGEKVIIINPQHTLKMYGYRNGDIFDVKMTHRVSVESTTKTPGRGDYLRFWEEEYRVLVPLESTSPQSTDDIIANLVGRLAKAERKIAELTEQSDSNAKDIRTWADDYTEFKSSPSLWATQSDVLSINAELGILRETSFDWSEKIEQKIEMLIDDVVAIDERTQPLTTEGVSELSEELTKVVTQAIDDKLRKVGR